MVTSNACIFNPVFIAYLPRQKTRSSYQWSSARHQKIVQFLIDNGADINAKDKEGLSPLHAGIVGGELAIIKLLIEHGAELNSKTIRGTTPLHWAAGYGHKDIASLLIEYGADINSKANQNQTPLHSASGSWDEQKEVVLFLLNNGAEVNTRMNNGKTPLGLALEKGYKNTVEILKQNGGIE